MAPRSPRVGSQATCQQRRRLIPAELPCGLFRKLFIDDTKFPFGDKRFSHFRMSAMVESGTKSIHYGLKRSPARGFANSRAGSGLPILGMRGGAGISSFWPSDVCAGYQGKPRLII